jgi:hypothetical protein
LFFHKKVKIEPIKGNSNNANKTPDIYCNIKLTIKIIPIAKDMIST